MQKKEYIKKYIYVQNMMESEIGREVGMKEDDDSNNNRVEMYIWQIKKKVELKGSAFELLCGDTNKRNEMAKEPFELWIGNWKL